MPGSNGTVDMIGMNLLSLFFLLYHLSQGSEECQTATSTCVFLSSLKKPCGSGKQRHRYSSQEEQLRPQCSRGCAFQQYSTQHDEACGEGKDDADDAYPERKGKQRNTHSGKE